MYQVVVPKALAPKELVQVFESGEMVVLPAWDPMVRVICYSIFGLPGRRLPYVFNVTSGLKDRLVATCLRGCVLIERVG